MEKIFETTHLREATDVHKLIQNFEKLKLFISKPKQISSGVFELKKTRNGAECSNFFFKEVRHKCASAGKYNSPDFIKIKGDVLEKFLKKNPERRNNILSVIEFLNHTPSKFPVSIAMALYDFFNASLVIDPFSGWGDRCLAAMACGVDYIGYDTNSDLIAPFEQLFDTFGPHSESNFVRFFNTSCVDLVSHADGGALFSAPPHAQSEWHSFCADVGYTSPARETHSGRGKRIVFSSPPFFSENGTLLENYDGMPHGSEDYAHFFDYVLIPMFDFFSGCVDCILLHLPENMYADLSKVYGKCDVCFYWSYSGNKRKRTEKIFVWIL
jgi:hypothetical protein